MPPAARENLFQNVAAFRFRHRWEMTHLEWSVTCMTVPGIDALMRISFEALVPEISFIHSGENETLSAVETNENLTPSIKESFLFSILSCEFDIFRPETRHRQIAPSGSPDFR